MSRTILSSALTIGALGVVGSIAVDGHRRSVLAEKLYPYVESVDGQQCISSRVALILCEELIYNVIAWNKIIIETGFVL